MFLLEDIKNIENVKFQNLFLIEEYIEYGNGIVKVYLLIFIFISSLYNTLCKGIIRTVIILIQRLNR